MKTSNKVISISSLLRKLEQAGERHKISACSGSFDLLHAGHVSYLKEARSHGDKLVVFLNTDESISLYKGPGRPIVPFKERAALLAAFPFVDYIVSLSELNPISLIEKLRPHVFCNGADWGKFAAERTIVEECGGKFVIVSAKTRALMSTSDLVARAARAQAQPVVRGLFIESNDIPNLLANNAISNSFFKAATAAGWLIFIVDHSSSTKKSAMVHKNQLSIFVTKVLLPKTNLSHRDTSLFEATVRKYGVVLSKSWHISFSGVGTSNARCANMKTLAIQNTPSYLRDTLYMSDRTIPTLKKAATLLV